MVLYEADFAEDTIYRFGGIFITCFSLCCAAWCAVCQRTVFCHFAASLWPLQNVNIHRHKGSDVRGINSSDTDTVGRITHTHTVRLHSQGTPCTLQHTTVQYGVYTDPFGGLVQNGLLLRGCINSSDGDRLGRA